VVVLTRKFKFIIYIHFSNIFKFFAFNDRMFDVLKIPFNVEFYLGHFLLAVICVISMPHID
jgi:hypothetical protein